MEEGDPTWEEEVKAFAPVASPEKKAAPPEQEVAAMQKGLDKCWPSSANSTESMTVTRPTSPTDLRFKRRLSPCF